MSLQALDNPVRIGQLKAEPRNETEARRMLVMARTRLDDARLRADAGTTQKGPSSFTRQTPLPRPLSRKGRGSHCAC